MAGDSGPAGGLAAAATPRGRGRATRPVPAGESRHLRGSIGTLPGIGRDAKYLAGRLAAASARRDETAAETRVAA